MLLLKLHADRLYMYLYFELWQVRAKFQSNVSNLFSFFCYTYMYILPSAQNHCLQTHVINTDI